jgi:hypothetical protein
MRKTLLLISMFAMSAVNTVFSQTAFQQVKTILQTNCGGSGCHGGSLPGFNVNDADATLRNALVGVAPLNPTAASKGDKLIDPGYPSSSFLLRKIAHNLDNYDLGLEASEGAAMPSGRPKMSDVDIEMVRQWILFGANLNDPDLPSGYTGINRANIEAYYSGNSKPRLARPTPPDPSEGFQLRMGPLFFGSREEAEYFQKYDLRLPDTIEVTRLDMFMNDESHHFILRKFAPGTKQNWTEGMQPLNVTTAFDEDKDYVMSWQDNGDIALPEKTAYRWETESALDLNFHMFNYHDSVLVGEVYINIYTQPKNTTQYVMKSDLIPNVTIFMPSSPTTVHKFRNSWNKNNISIWSLTSHTHSRGIDYDIYTRNVDGTIGAKIYEGFEKDGVNFGFYDWEHPPTQIFEPMFYLEPGVHTGLIDSAKYINNTGGIMSWGFTTDREMMLYYVQYVDGVFDPSTNIEEPAFTSVKSDFNVFPNPFQNRTEIKYTLATESEVKLEVYDLTGRKVKTFANTKFQAGTYNYIFETESLAKDAVYLVKLTIDGNSTFKKIIQQ